MKKILLVAGLLMCGHGGAAIALPVTLDFDALSNPPGVSGLPNTHGTTIDEDGFRLITNASFGGFASFSPSSGFYTGSTSLFSNTVGSFTTLSQINGDSFSMAGIALAFRTVPESQTASLTFTGVKSGGPVTQTFSFVQGPTISVQNFSFGASFSDLLSVSWIQGNEGHQFDNIQVDGAPVAAPEPGMLALFGLGLAGLGFVRGGR